MFRHVTSSCMFLLRLFEVYKYIHRIHKWRTRGKKLVPSHESEALEGEQKLQMKTFSELAECLARIPPKNNFVRTSFKIQLRGMSSAFNV